MLVAPSPLRNRPTTAHGNCRTSLLKESYREVQRSARAERIEYLKRRTKEAEAASTAVAARLWLLSRDYRAIDGNTLRNLAECLHNNPQSLVADDEEENAK